MKKFIVFIFLLLSIFINIANAIEAPNSKVGSEAKIALVIGNGTYKESPLINPPNDSRAVSETLTKLGFKVILVENGTFSQMQDALRNFGDQLKINGGVGLFYYAGHGIQYKNSNYLLPVDADIQREDEVPFVAFDVTRVLQKIESAGNRLNVVILDACRNNPYAKSFRSASRGLAQMDAPSGTIVAFSTAPGSVASDGSGSNGLYTQHLLANMTEPNLKIEEVFKKVRVAVKQASQGQQVPWENTSLEGDFYFNPTSEKITPSVSIQKTAMASPNAAGNKNDSTRSVFAGDKWRYQFLSKTSGKKGQALFEVTDFKKDQIAEIVKLNIVNESPYEVFRELGANTGIVGFMTQNGRKYHEFAPYTTMFQTVDEKTKWKGLTKEVPVASYLSSSAWTLAMENEGKETITVPAGKFDAIKLKVSGQRPTGQNYCGWNEAGSFEQIVWYSQSVKRFIKQQMVTYSCSVAGGKGAYLDDEVLELIDYVQN